MKNNSTSLGAQSLAEHPGTNHAPLQPSNPLEVKAAKPPEGRNTELIVEYTKIAGQRASVELSAAE